MTPNISDVGEESLSRFSPRLNPSLSLPEVLQQRPKGRPPYRTNQTLGAIPLRWLPAGAPQLFPRRFVWTPSDLLHPTVIGMRFDHVS